MSSTVGMRLRMTIYGESHGPSIGIVLDGLPPNITIDLGAIEKEMARRVPGQSPLSTHRKETDQFTIESGFFEGKTTGMALCARHCESRCPFQGLFPVKGCHASQPWRLSGLCEVSWSQ